MSWAFSSELRRPTVTGSFAYLLLNFPIGVAGFVVLLTLMLVGTATAIIWVGVPLLALLVLLTRGAAQAERARVYAMLGAYVPAPHRPLPTGDRMRRWRTRVTDSVTWREYTYFMLLLPIGIAQFVVLVAFWCVCLALLALPVYYRWLPGGAWYFPVDENLYWVMVDSVGKALPWAALGLLLAVGTALFTRRMGAAHARFAQAMLGPTDARTRELDDAAPDAPQSVTAE